jgi:transcription-repair coupling factor (superfamily II helicase)
MAMSGIRDISVIETPPTSRVNTITEVIEYSANLLKSAIENEIARNGQALVVYNKVESI